MECGEGTMPAAFFTAYDIPEALTFVTVDL
jgi:hypothetical protein